MIQMIDAHHLGVALGAQADAPPCARGTVLSFK